MNNMNRLKDCQIGDIFSIKYLDGTLEQKRHLQNLGFVPTSIIYVINKNEDNMIIQLFDSRIAINDEISNNIYGVILKKNIKSQKILSLYKRR